MPGSRGCRLGERASSSRGNWIGECQGEDRRWTVGVSEVIKEEREGGEAFVP